jgi:hypothetical protein
LIESQDARLFVSHQLKAAKTKRSQNIPAEMHFNSRKIRIPTAVQNGKVIEKK